jgi:hypothetical protein
MKEITYLRTVNECTSLNKIRKEDVHIYIHSIYIRVDA